MRVFTCLCAVALVTASLTCFAESDVPDLKGVWVIKSMAIVHDKLAERQPKAHTDVRKGFVELDMTLTIDKQEGVRFSGVNASDKRKETVSGVIGFDNKSVYMVDDDGIMLCRLVSKDKMEQIYLHVTKYRSVAARSVLIRKR